MSRIPTKVRPAREPSADSCAELREFLPWGYVKLDDEIRIEDVNVAASSLFGMPRADLLGCSLQTYLSDDCAGVLLDVLAQCRAASGIGRDVSMEFLARDGSTRHVRVHVQSFAGHGRVRYRMAILDLTEVRRANLALRKVADEMRDLYQNAPCGYHSLDPDGVVLKINDTELGWLGYEREEIVPRVRLTELMSEHCRGDFQAAFDALKAHGQVRDLELEYRRKDGSVFPVLLSATGLRDIHGRFLESRASVFDVTRRRLAEEESRRYAQRLKGMSRRAAEVQEIERRTLARELHDRVGQNLTALNINLNILKGATAATTSVLTRARLEDSLRIVDRTIESIRDVMTELRPAVLDDYGLAAVLRWYADEFSRRTNLPVEVVGCDPEPRLAQAVEMTLFRIVQESLTNVAKHAGAHRAKLLLEARVRCFCLSVIDDGSGFDPAALDGMNDHHGWGLMIMRERAESVGGQFRVDSTPGRGTRVVIEMRV